MARGGDGKELGDALYEGQHDDLKNEHGLATPGLGQVGRIRLPLGPYALYTRSPEGNCGRTCRRRPSCQCQG
jgi:hypothetical protein